MHLPDGREKGIAYSWDHPSTFWHSWIFCHFCPVQEERSARLACQKAQICLYFSAGLLCTRGLMLSMSSCRRHTLHQSKITPEKCGWKTIISYSFHLGWLSDRCYVSFEGSHSVHIRMAEAVLAQSFVLRLPAWRSCLPFWANLSKLVWKGIAALSHRDLAVKL